MAYVLPYVVARRFDLKAVLKQLKPLRPKAAPLPETLGDDLGVSRADLTGVLRETAPDPRDLDRVRFFAG